MKTLAARAVLKCAFESPEWALVPSLTPAGASGLLQFGHGRASAPVFSELPAQRDCDGVRDASVSAVRRLPGKLCHRAAVNHEN